MDPRRRPDPDPDSDKRRKKKQRRQNDPLLVMKGGRFRLYKRKNRVGDWVRADPPPGKGERGVSKDSIISRCAREVGFDRGQNATASDAHQQEAVRRANSDINQAATDARDRVDNISNFECFVLVSD